MAVELCLDTQLLEIISEAFTAARGLEHKIYLMEITKLCHRNLPSISSCWWAFVDSFTTGIVENIIISYIITTCVKRI